VAADGKLAMFTRRLDLMNLLAETGDATAAQVAAPLFEPSQFVNGPDRATSLSK
jgi:hypothetical protein